MPSFDLPGALRRIRRQADLSQRDLARAIQTSKSTVADAETGRSGLDVRLLASAAERAGLRLALIDAEGAEVAGMSGAAVRDMAGRRFSAHLDTRHGDERWWHGPERYSREQPWYTFDRLRDTRDYWRSRTGTPEDHQLPQPGHSPADRAEARGRAARETGGKRPVDADSTGNRRRRSRCGSARARRSATSSTTAPASRCTRRSAHVTAMWRDALLP